MQKISQLDEGQLEKLSRFLDTIQTEEIPFEIPTDKAVEKPFDKQSFTSPKPKPVIHKHKRPYSSKGNEEKKEFFEIELRVLTTWGHAHLVGLTEIEVFNENSEQIKLIPSNLQIKNTGHGVLSNPSKLIDGEKYTEEEKHMWLGPMPQPPGNLEILITLPSTENVAGMRLWNYNKSLLDSVKGVREIEVWKDGKLVWEGTVTRGCGNPYDDYFTDIPLVANFTLKTGNKEVSEDHKPEIEQNPSSAPMWLPGKLNFKEEEKREDKLRPVASVPRVRHNQPFDILAEDKKRIETSDNHMSPAILNFKKTSSTSRDKKTIPEFNDPALIPEPTLKLLGLNNKKQRQIEPLKESLDSLEYFKITNESRIKRDTLAKPKPLEEIKEKRKDKRDKIPEIPEFKVDALDRFMAEQIAPKPQSYEETKIASYPKGQVLKFTILST